MMKKIINKFIVLFILFNLLLPSCSFAPWKVTNFLYKDFEQVYKTNYKKYYYSDLKENVFPLCLYCHSSRFPNPNNYDDLMNVIVKTNPKNSRLFYMLYSGRMPKGGRISRDQKQMIYNWIRDGAKNDSREANQSE